MDHGRYDLTEFEWKVIEPLLPNKPHGVPRVDDRRVLNGIFYQLRSGSPWADLPERYGPYTTVYNRFNRWRKAGVWDRLMDAIIATYETKSQKLQIELSPGQVHDAPMAELLLQDLPKGTSLLADRGYDADWIRDMIKDQDCTHVIPPKSNRIENVPFSKRKYRKRNLVERCINKLKQFRHIATRYDRHASAYLAFDKLEAIRLWLRFYESAA